MTAFSTLDHEAVGRARWSTSSFGEAAAASANETSTLGEHLHVCRVGASRLFGLACGAEAMHRFVTSRFVTTLSLVALLIGIGLAAA